MICQNSHSIKKKKKKSGIVVLGFNQVCWQTLNIYLYIYIYIYIYRERERERERERVVPI